jgi:hypothetical protein
MRDASLPHNRNNEPLQKGGTYFETHVCSIKVSSIYDTMGAEAEVYMALS